MVMSLASFGMVISGTTAKPSEVTMSPSPVCFSDPSRV